MGYESNWAATSDVVRNHYGQRNIDEQYGGQSASSGETKTIFLNVEFDDVQDLGGNMAAFIPNGARISSVVVRAKDAWVGGQSIFFGTYNEAGTAIDQDGLMPATESSELNLVEDAVIVGASGSLLNAVVLEDSYVGWEFTSAFTAGSLTLQVDYIEKRHA